MRFDERVEVLCVQALATRDDAEVQRILAELRHVVHQRVEQLRRGLFAMYSPTTLHPAVRYPDRLTTPLESRKDSRIPVASARSDKALSVCILVNRD